MLKFSFRMFIQITKLGIERVRGIEELEKRKAGYKTFAEFARSLRVEWKKWKKILYNSRVSLHEAPTKKVESFSFMSKVEL